MQIKTVKTIKQCSNRTINLLVHFQFNHTHSLQKMTDRNSQNTQTVF